MAAHSDIGPFDLGEDWSIQVTCHNADGSIMDLTGATLEMAISTADAPLIIDVSNGVSIPAPTTGVASILVAPATQAGLADGLHSYTVRVTKGGIVTDQAWGFISLRATEF